MVGGLNALTIAVGSYGTFFGFFRWCRLVNRSPTSLFFASVDCKDFESNELEVRILKELRAHLVEVPILKGRRAGKGV